MTMILYLPVFSLFRYPQKQCRDSLTVVESTEARLEAKYTTNTLKPCYKYRPQLYRFLNMADIQASSQKWSSVSVLEYCIVIGSFYDNRIQCMPLPYNG